jgi:hypothetical protein
MQVGDLVKMKCTYTWDPIVGLLIEKEKEPKSRFSFAVVLWPHGVKDTVGSWLEVVK